MSTVHPLQHPSSSSSSLATLPIIEGDIGDHRTTDDDPDTPHSQLKGKETLGSHYSEDEAFESSDATTYPPTNDNEAETRRVEDTLRKWEIAERQRRKAARESAQLAPASSSLVSDVTRRASHLFTGRTRVPNKSLGKHASLQSQEDINTPSSSPSLSPSPSPSPSPSLSPTYSEQDSTIPSQNPFDNPPVSLSPFADAHQVKSARDTYKHKGIKQSTPNNSTKRTSLAAPAPSTSRKRRNPPSPQPLGLPPPRTPPPLMDLPSPTAATHEERIEEMKETRWWHDWLCGCGEGPDRGGDFQAGRTNPFE